jgi:DNA topoisomerase-3
MNLVIAEKPSVAQSIAAVLGANNRQDGYITGNGYAVSWCVGHLAELASAEAYDAKYAKWKAEDLPILPQEWQYVISDDKKKQFAVLKNLMQDKNTETVICATDAGREGELIFRLVYNLAKCNKPIKRLWISSMEDAAIKSGFENLKNGSEYENLYQSALCRAQADWLIGINATRLFSCLYGETLRVGRVQSPTLALLVSREAAIAGFQSMPFYTPEIDLGNFKAAGERTEDKAAAEKVRSDADGKDAKVLAITKQEKSALPPKLFDLTSLQREANKLFGFTAQQTLDYTQSLYEKKIVTYPRTDSKYLTDDMKEAAEGLASLLMGHLSYAKDTDLAPNLAHVTNSEKVSDHHAIIPTMEYLNADLSELPSGEQDIVNLIAARLLCAAAPVHTYEAVTAELTCSGHAFKSKGKTILQDGWKAIETAYRTSMKKQAEPDGDIEDSGALPELAEGQIFQNVSATIREGKTEPPKHYTEDTLLSAMETAGAEDMPEDAERKGLGTPATRAGVIEKIIKSGFVERKKKNLIPTAKGNNLIAVLPDTVKSPLLTAEWEHGLKRVERGMAEADDFMSGIEKMAAELTVSHDKPNPDFASLFSGGNKGEAIGVCPRCGLPVRERGKGFFCDSRACGFALWKDNKFFASKRQTVTRKIAATLLKEGRIHIDDLYSEKKDRTYGADVLLDDTGKYANFKLEFNNATGKKNHKK